MEQNIIVTGGAGFIGSHCADFLIEKGYRVVIVDDLSFGQKKNVNHNAIFIETDISKMKNIEDVILDYKPSHIFHFAANATTKSTSMGWKNPVNDYKINMVGTLNLLEILRKNNIDAHFIYASTAAVYGEPKTIPINENDDTYPLSPYGISKLAGEKYCYAYSKEWKIRTTILRIFNTYGPRQPRYVMHDQMKNILNTKGESFSVLGDGTQIRDYSYVSDTVSAFYLAMKSPSKSVGKVFNIAGGSKISIKDLIFLIKKTLNSSKKEIYTGQSWKGDIKNLSADTSRIKKDLRWAPKVKLEDGLHNLAEWLYNNESI